MGCTGQKCRKIRLLAGKELVLGWRDPNAANVRGIIVVPGPFRPKVPWRIKRDGQLIHSSLATMAKCSL